MKSICLLTLTLLISLSSFAQVQDTTKITVEPAQEPVKKESKFDKSKLYFGGYANMSFGKYTVIGVQPLVGYKLIPQFSVGAKLSYEYIEDKRYVEDYSTSNYGASVFSRLRILPTLYAHAEFSSMNYDLQYSAGESNRKWIPFLYVGGGYSQRISKNTYLNAQILFDVINNNNSPYKDWEPYYSVGIGVGF